MKLLKEIKILGPGCPNCKILYKITNEVVEENKIDADIIKVEDIMDIMSYGIVATPAIIVDGKVILKGRVPSKNELKDLLTK